MKVKDSQRSKVRKSVEEWRDILKKSEPVLIYPEMMGVKRYVTNIVNSAWFRKKYFWIGAYKLEDGRRRRSISCVRMNSPRVEHPTEHYLGFMESGCDDIRKYLLDRGLLEKSNFTLKCPKWSRTRETLLQSLAYSIRDFDLNEYAAHDWQYCKNLIDLVQRWLGKEKANILKEVFKKNKVKYKAPRKLSQK